jgi:hypothetical protein
MNWGEWIWKKVCRAPKGACHVFKDILVINDLKARARLRYIFLITWPCDLFNYYTTQHRQNSQGFWHAMFVFSNVKMKWFWPLRGVLQRLKSNHVHGAKRNQHVKNARTSNDRGIFCFRNCRGYSWLSHDAELKELRESSNNSNKFEYSNIQLRIFEILL